MENVLRMDNFQELTHDELMLVDGGNIFWDVVQGAIVGAVTGGLAGAATGTKYGGVKGAAVGGVIGAAGGLIDGTITAIRNN